MLPGDVDGIAERDSLASFTATPDAWQLVLLRVGVATVLLLHSLGRLGIGPRSTLNVEAFGRSLSTIGIPMPSVMAWIVTVVEVVGGVCLLLGLLTSLAALLVAVNMAVAFGVAHWPYGFLGNGSDIELTMLMTLVALSLAASGAGPISLERALFGEELTRLGALATRLR